MSESHHQINAAATNTTIEDPMQQITVAQTPMAVFF